jgi:tetratricopeptide (TPR) repeat protein
VLALAPLPALGLRTRVRAARRRTAPSSAAALRALERAPELAADPRHVRRVFTGALGDRLRLNPDAFSRPGALARKLRRAGVSAEVAGDAERFLRSLDEAAYSRAGTVPGDASARALSLFRAVDREALARFELDASHAIIIVLAASAVLGTGVLAALSDDVARREFALGVSAYQSHHFEAARSAFAASASQEPWAADAWANLGTAAWAAADTARAVAGWQRALRLEPMAADARERLDLVHTTTLASQGFVPPVPVPAVLWLAALAWCAAWALAAMRAASRPLMGATVDRRWAYALGTVAVLLVLGALDVDQRLTARRLAVMRATTRLSTDPTLGGASSGSAIVGEVALVASRQGAWTRVVLDDGREGWVESANVMSLERGTSPPPT